jgi:putative endonuclease
MSPDSVTQRTVNSTHTPHHRSMQHRYSVYIMASRSHTLYIGMTNDLPRRVREHKNHSFEGFTAHYNIDRLVWYEVYPYVRSAIAREKQLKGWLRERKIHLIEDSNPTWQDLSEDWKNRLFRCGRTADPSTPAGNSSPPPLRMTIRKGEPIEPNLACDLERARAPSRIVILSEAKDLRFAGSGRMPPSNRYLTNCHPERSRRTCGSAGSGRMLTLLQ